MLLRDMRDEIESTNLLALDVYDVAFKKRQEWLDKAQHASFQQRQAQKKGITAPFSTRLCACVSKKTHELFPSSSH